MHWLSPCFNMDTKRLASIETKVFRRTARCALFDQKNEIFGGLKVHPVYEKLIRHKSNWLWLLKRIDNNRKPKIMLTYGRNWIYGLENLWRDIRRGRNRSIKAQLVTDDDNDDDVDDDNYGELQCILLHMYARRLIDKSRRILPLLTFYLKDTL